MIEPRKYIALLVGALVAILLQVIIAPVIQIANAVPNFILAYVVVVALLKPQDCGYIFPFVLGLIYDLVGNGPVGGMALLCVAITFAISNLLLVLNNDTLFIPIFLLVIGMFIVNILYGLLMIAGGMDVNLFDSIVMRSLPCGLYDTVIGLIAFPLVLRFVVGDNGKSQSGLF